MKLQKLGGYAAIASICVFIVYAVYANHIFSSVNLKDPADIMAVMSSTSGEFYVLNLLYLLYLIFLLILGVALHERMHADAPYLSHMMLIAAVVNSAIGIISTMVTIKSIGMIVPTQDLSAFMTYWTIREGLNSASGYATAWSFLFAGCAILVTRSFSVVLGWLVVVTGILWIPAFFIIHIGFNRILPNLLNIMSFAAMIWIGTAMLRKKHPNYRTDK